MEFFSFDNDGKFHIYDPLFGMPDENKVKDSGAELVVEETPLKVNESSSTSKPARKFTFRRLNSKDVHCGCDII